MGIITVATAKGGAGKTLLCEVLAGALASQMRVVAIDVEPHRCAVALSGAGV
ncbi:MAG: ParA family protein [Rhodopila sp.]